MRDLTEADFRQVRALYWGMVSEVDAQLGRVLAAVKQAGAWGETIVILTSDHAELMGDHFLLGKGGFFDGSFHIPLIIRDPRSSGTAGTSVDRFTEAVDVMPTLLDLLGEEPALHLDGRSLKPFLDGQEPPGWREAAHWEFDFRSIDKGTAESHFGISPQRCNLAVLRGERFKYVHFGGGLPPLLFDLARGSRRTEEFRGRPGVAARQAGACRETAGLACRASRSVAGARPVDSGRRPGTSRSAAAS